MSIYAKLTGSAVKHLQNHLRPPTVPLAQSYEINMLADLHKIAYNSEMTKQSSQVRLALLHVAGILTWVLFMTLILEKCAYSFGNATSHFQENIKAGTATGSLALQAVILPMY